MAFDINFIDEGNPAIEILAEVLNLAGPNFGVPYDSSQQPYDMISANSDALASFIAPAGGQLSGLAYPNGNMGAVVNSVISQLAPLMSAYSFILPILGIIKGILEIMCCFKSITCVIKAVKKLFKKWLPAFLSLYPPIAGVIIIIGVIKLILIIVYYIMTEVIPTLVLVRENIKTLRDALSEIKKDDLSDPQVRANRAKLYSLLETLIQKAGIIRTFRPLLELIFIILNISFGLPCKKKKSGAKDEDDDEDCSSCDECIDILSIRSEAPRGTGILLRSNFGEKAPGFVYKIVISDPKILEIIPYFENLDGQLGSQLDNPVKTAKPIGSSDGNASTFDIKISSRRGSSRSITIPILDISDTGTVKITSPLASLFEDNLVDFEVIPNYDMLIDKSIMPVACHPDIVAAKNDVYSGFEAQLPGSAIGNNPEIEDILPDYDKASATFSDGISDATKIIDSLDTPPFDLQLAGILEIENNIVSSFTEFSEKLNIALNAIINRNISDRLSGIDVDKNVTRPGTDVIITITPRDITGVSLIKNVPDTVSVNVNIITDFGTISDKAIDRVSGVITAKITSNVIGIATISAKINGNLLVSTVLDGSGDTIARTKSVSFIADTTLPIRRKRSKPSTKSAINAGATSGVDNNK